MAWIFKRIIVALIGVLTEVLVSVVAASIHIPGKYPLVAFVVLVVLVILTVALDSNLPDGRTVLSHRKVAKFWHAHMSKRPGPGRKFRIISGARTGSIGGYMTVTTLYKGLTAPASIMIVTGIICTVMIANIAAVSMLITIAVPCVVLLARYSIGARARLIFFKAGICFIDRDSIGFMPWGEADSFRVEPTLNYKKEYLVADPIPGSWPPGRRGFPDKKWGAIKICNLTKSRINSEAVNAALSEWYHCRQAGSRDRQGSRRV